MLLKIKATLGKCLHWSNGRHNGNLKIKSDLTMGFCNFDYRILAKNMCVGGTFTLNCGSDTVVLPQTRGTADQVITRDGPSNTSVTIKNMTLNVEKVLMYS
jgi:hypothetical protein